MLLEYNGIILPYCDLSSFKMEAVYEESKTDKILTKFDISVSCLISADLLDQIAPTYYGSTDDPAFIVALVQEALLKPRQKLSFRFNDYEFIPQPAGVRGYVDAKNGPQPQSFTPVRMDEVSWWCTYHITAHYVVSYSVGVSADAKSSRFFMSNLPGNVVLYNRWSESVSIDKRQYSTKTRRGKFMIRSDNDAASIADELRTQMAVLGVPRGFVRDSSNYTVDPSGLGLVYNVVDREVYQMPPDGTYDAEGTYTEQASKGDGKRTASCSITLKGSKLTKRSDLMRRAANLCASALNARAGEFIPKGGKPLFNAESVVIVNQKTRKAGVLVGASARFDLFDNVCTVSMATILPASRTWYGSKDLIPFVDAPATGKPELPGFPQPKYFDRGSAGLLLTAAAYFDPAIQGIELQDRQGFFAESNAQTTAEDAAKTQMKDGSIPGTAGVAGQ